VGGIGPYHEEDEVKLSRDYLREVDRAERASRIFLALLGIVGAVIIWTIGRHFFGGSR
jgi:hypothetical protein